MYMILLSKKMVTNIMHNLVSFHSNTKEEQCQRMFK